MSTPKAALNALIAPGCVTLGQAALLEKIGSPLLGSAETVPAADAIPGLYLLSLPAAEGVAHLPTLEHDAFVWADTLTPADFKARQEAAIAALRAFYAMLPGPEDATKKASPATVG